MSTPDPPADLPETTRVPGPQDWTDRDALFASDMWLSMKAPPELIAQYRGMHVAIIGEQIIDADRDRQELCRRLDAKGDAVSVNRLLLRYIPTDEEALSRW